MPFSKALEALLLSPQAKLQSTLASTGQRMECGGKDANGVTATTAPDARRQRTLRKQTAMELRHASAVTVNKYVS